MLNREEILIKVMQILDFDMKDIKLKQSTEKKRFTTFEQSSEKTKEQIKLIFKALNLDEVNSELIDIFRDLIYLYEEIEKKLLFRLGKVYERKLNWIILKRLVVPYLAYRFANLDTEYNNRIDKNMPGGRFWYLLDLRDFNDIKMPIQTLMKWWLDLYGGGLDSLCNEIDEQSNENQAFESINTLKPWLYKSKLPKRATIELYLSQNINYKGVFKRESKNKVSVEFERCKDFIKAKGLTAETLSDEIPERTLIKEILDEEEKISNKGKILFIKLISERWTEPSKESLISKFVIARAVQNLYGKLIDYFDIEKDSMRIEENKVLQLFYQYEILYNIEISQSMNYNLGDISEMINYEYLAPFNSNNLKIIRTISTDINAELNNTSVDKYNLEEAYLIISTYAMVINDLKLAEKSFKEYEKFDENFRQKPDNYINEIKVYNTLNNKDFDLKLQGENDFELLLHLFKHTDLESKDYIRAEKICFQISKVVKNNEQSLKALDSFLSIYTDIMINKNESQYITTKHFLEQYLKLVSEEKIDEQRQSESLVFQILFYLKSKKFKESLFFCDEYFSKFIFKQKKEKLHSVIVYISAYCAYTVKDKQKLKKYNKFLKKHHSIEFANQKSLPFTIYFYK